MEAELIIFVVIVTHIQGSADAKPSQDLIILSLFTYVTTALQRLQFIIILLMDLEIHEDTQGYEEISRGQAVYT